jgi:hypothetical protein
MGLALEFWFSFPLRIGTDMRIVKLYEFEFGTKFVITMPSCDE